MNLRFNKILAGVILLLIGIASLFPRYLSFDYKSLMIFFSGLGFLLLYKTKQKIWSLVLGCYISYLGALSFATGLGLGSLIPSSAAAMFFLIPGIIFLVLYNDKNKRGLLLPGILFIWIGVYVFVGNLNIIGIFNINGAAIFLFCVGLSFICSYFVGRDFLPRAVFYLGLAIIIIGFITMKDHFDNGIFNPLFFMDGMSWLASCLLIIFAVVIIFKQFKKK